MIPLKLLKDTQDRAVGFVTYGPGEMHKSLAAVTLPPPVLMFDMEGGTGALQPWIRRSKKGSGDWVEKSQADRERLYAKIASKDTIKIRPQPLVDIVYLDTLDPASYDLLKAYTFSRSILPYNSIVIDPLMEMSVATQTHEKVGKGAGPDDVMELKYWGAAQEKMSIVMRKMRIHREKGIFVYFTGAEDIDKDYVTDPRNSQGQPTAYAVKGTISVPGKMTGLIHHFADCMAHARKVNQERTWVFTSEPLTGGQANWEAKDRYGYFDAHEPPNFRHLLGKIYGAETRDAIYTHWKLEESKA